MGDDPRFTLNPMEPHPATNSAIRWLRAWQAADPTRVFVVSEAFASTAIEGKVCKRLPERHGS